MRDVARSPEKLDVWKTPAVFVLFLILLLILFNLFDVFSAANDARHAIFSLPEIFRSNDLYKQRVIKTISDEGFDMDTFVDTLIDNQRFQSIMADTNQKAVQLMQNYDKAVEEKLERLLSGESENREKLMADIEQLRDRFRTELRELTDGKLSSLEKKVEDVNIMADGRSDRLQRRLTVLQNEVDSAHRQMEDFKSSRIVGSGDPDKMGRMQSQLREVESHTLKLEKEVRTVMESLKNCNKDKELLALKMKEDVIESLVKAMNGESDGKYPKLDAVIGELKQSTLTESEFKTMVSSLKDKLIDDVRKEVYNPEIITQHLEAVTKPEMGNQKFEFNREDLEAIVNNKLGVYDADKTGQFDYAMESAGGLIESTRCTKTYAKSSAYYSVMGINIWSETTNPKMILRPGTHPGQCWAFKGDQGSVVIRLSHKIKVQAIAIEHIPAILSPDGRIASAPKAFEIRGLEKVDDPNPVLLGNFTYQDNNQPIQTFATDGGETNILDLVEVTVLSNHGHPSYTCIYRVRIHGSLE